MVSRITAPKPHILHFLSGWMFSQARHERAVFRTDFMSRVVSVLPVSVAIVLVWKPNIDDKVRS